MKRVLHTSSNRGFQAFQYAGDFVPAGFAQGLAFALAHGDVRCGIRIGHYIDSFLNTFVACIGKHQLFFTMQQVVIIVNVGCVGGVVFSV